MPEEVIWDIMLFLKPLEILFISKLFYTITCKADYWQELWERDFSWLTKSIPSLKDEQQNYQALYQIFTQYQPITKKVDNSHIFFEIEQLQKIFQEINITLDSKTIPALDCLDLIKARFTVKPSAITAYRLGDYYTKLFYQEGEEIYRNQAVSWLEKTFQIGFELKVTPIKSPITNDILSYVYPKDRDFAIAILSNLYPSGSLQLFEFLEKNYVYTQISHIISKFNCAETLQQLHDRWWQEMTETKLPSEKCARAAGLLDLYLKYKQHWKLYDSVSAHLTKKEINERIEVLQEIVIQNKPTRASPAKNSGLFPQQHSDSKPNIETPQSPFTFG